MISKLPDNFELTKEFEDIIESIDSTDNPVFITGNAGTGKSTLLQYYIETTNDIPIILAPTGVAAVNVGGTTIHKFFHFPPRFINLDSIFYDRGWKFHHCLKTIIIDEISMVRADMIDNIDVFLRRNMQKDIPFGGVKVIMIGDIRQLSPVIEKDIHWFFKDVYDSPFFFSAKVFTEVDIETYNLKHIFRQKDPEFISILNNIRDGKITMKDRESLNTRVGIKLDGNTIILTTTNTAADSFNQVQLSRLKTEKRVYKAEIKGSFDSKFFPTSEYLELKIDAQIMMLRNGPGYYNGTICRVVKMEDETITVEDDEGRNFCIAPVSWERIEYDSDDDNRISGKEVGTFTQFPIKLAWAITIHKSQGLTFDKVNIDLGRGSFAHGQTYVALSRCRSLEGISLRRPISARDIIFDKSVLNIK